MLETQICVIRPHCVKMEEAVAATFEVWLTSCLENSLLAYH